MSKHKHKKHKPKSHGGGGAGGAHQPDHSALLAQLDERIEQLLEADESTRVGPIWGEVHKLLLKLHADADAAARVITSRDIDALQELIAPKSDQPASQGEQTETDESATDDADTGADVSAETLKKALRAFRKRLKLTRLDHESRLGRGAMTGGKKADFDAILAPYEFPKEVWQALAARGDLIDMGQGFYKLSDEAAS